MTSVVVGTDPECDLCLPDYKLSAKHFEVYGHYGNVRVRDLGSLNGTRVRSYPGAPWRTVNFGMPVPIQIGASILAGRTMITIDFTGRVTCQTGISDDEMFRLLANI